MFFNDRHHAGILLARKLISFRDSASVVLGLSRGGVAVANAVARELGLPLSVLVVKKIPSPTNCEFAVGALAPDGVVYMDWQIAQSVGADTHYISSQKHLLSSEIRQKISLYKKARKPLIIKGKTVIVVDDGAATGATMQAAIMWLEKKNAKKIVIALPVASESFINTMKKGNVTLVVLETLSDFRSVGACYENFSQVSDEEVIGLIRNYSDFLT